MGTEPRTGRVDAVGSRSLAELLGCPQETGELLNRSAQCLPFDVGEVVFRQSGICQGLYVLISGRFMRSAECLKMRLMLSPAGGGDLVELAAVLGNGRHNYTLSAQSPGVAFMLPLEALEQAFRSYPQLRMQLLEELAREVSRAYHSCRLIHAAQGRRQGLKGAQA